MVLYTIKIRRNFSANQPTNVPKCHECKRYKQARKKNPVDVAHGSIMHPDVDAACLPDLAVGAGEDGG